MQPQKGPLTFGAQLKVLSQHSDGMSLEDIAAQHSVDPMMIQNILAREERLVQSQSQPTIRNHLQLKDKLVVLHELNQGATKSALSRKFNCRRKTITRINSKKSELQAMDRNRVNLTVKKLLKTKFPEIEDHVVNFITFTRNQRLPVTMSLIQERAKMIAESLGIMNFAASRGWLDKFLRRSPIQPSFKLYGKGNASLPALHAERMNELRQIVSEYEVRNVYNMDESGLFYRMGPRRSYLSANERRSQTRGTEFNKHKERVTIVLSCNADGSHILPVQYIGSAANPRCFRDHHYDNQRLRYNSQKNGWMDSAGFNKWITWWYNEVKNQSPGPWLLIMDNCGGHEKDLELPGLRIEYLPPRTTAKYQPLDLGLIAHSKVRYRSALLRKSIQIILNRTASNETYPTSNQGRRLGIRHGFLLTVGDAMELYDEAWSNNTRTTVLKCWIKSQCLSETQSSYCRSIIQDLTSTNVSSQWTGTDISPPISQMEAQEIADNLTVAHALSSPSIDIQELIDDANLLVNAASILEVLNASAPFDRDLERHEVSNTSVQDLYNDFLDNQAASSNQALPASSHRFGTNTQAMFNAIRAAYSEVQDEDMKNAMDLLLSRDA